MIPPTELLVADLFPTPRWLPQRMDSAQMHVRMMRFSEADYRAAPFLDQRGLRAGMAAALLPWSRVEAAVPSDARRDAHWIFHLSHVGSTLISKLLGAFDEVLPLREPRPLIGLTRLPGDQRGPRLSALRALYSRTFRPRQRALIKVTSSVSEIAPDLVGTAADGGRALLLRTRPDRFIAARLAMPTPEWLDRAPRRLERLKARAPDLVDANALASPARLAAMSWACEATSLEAAARVIGEDRARMVDFDRFLDDPVEGLRAIVTFFDLDLEARQIDKVARGEVMATHSKGRGNAFDAGERQRLVEDTLAAKTRDIGEALSWLEHVAATSPTLSAALAR